MQEIHNRSVYRHYQGELYYVIGIAIEAGIEKVVYHTHNNENDLQLIDKNTFLEDISEHKENATGQKRKFELYQDVMEAEKQRRDRAGKRTAIKDINGNYIRIGDILQDNIPSKGIVKLVDGKLYVTTDFMGTDIHSLEKADRLDQSLVDQNYMKIIGNIDERMFLG